VCGSSGYMLLASGIFSLCHATEKGGLCFDDLTTSKLNNVQKMKI